MGSKVPPKSPIGPVPVASIQAARVPARGKRSPTREFDDQQRHLIPGITVLLPLDHAVGARNACRETRERQARGAAPRGFQSRRRALPAARIESVVLRGAPRVVNLARQRPQREHRLDAFAAQAREDAHRPRHVAAQCGLAELKHIVARAVADRRLHGAEIDLLSGREQLEFLKLLLRCQQVSFGTLDDELHRRIIELEFQRGSTRAQPLRQSCDFNRPHRQPRAGRFRMP